MTNIKIKDGPKGLKSVAYHYGGYLDVQSKDGYRRYQLRAAVKELEKLYEEKGQVTFRLTLIDDLMFTATTNPAAFSQMTGDQKFGPQPGDFPIIPGAKSPGSLNGDSVKGGIVILVLIWIVWGLFSGGDDIAKPPEPERITEDTAQAMAKTLCEDRVEKSLRSPSTADFPFLSQAVYDGNGRATLASYVDAQNGFGATVRTNFVCVIEYTGDGSPSGFENWKIVDFAVLK